MVWKKMDTFIPILSQINHYDEKHEDQTRSCRNSGLCSVHHRKFTCNFTFFQRQLARGYQGENLPVYPKSATNFIAWSEYYYQNGLRVTKNKITFILKLLKKAWLGWNLLSIAKTVCPFFFRYPFFIWKSHNKFLIEGISYVWADL